MEAPHPRRGGTLARLLLVDAAGVLILLVGAEIFLSAIDPPASAPYGVHPPNISVTVKVDPGVTTGVNDDSVFETNTLGLRGPLPTPDDRVRILAIGGSTTECLVLSLEESWPWRLGRLLSERMGTTVWVGNAGRAGRNTRQHYFDARYVVPELGRVDVVILLVGINDLFNRMIQGDAFEEADVVALDAGGSYIRSALEVTAAPDEWVDRLHLVRRGRLALERLRLLSPRDRELRRTLNHALPDFYVWAREMRAAGRPLDTIPPMDGPLAEFARNLSLILDELQAHGATPVLVTQPAMWRDDLTDKERGALWLGSADGWPPRTEGGPYYTVRVMENLLEDYNGVLRRMAARRGVGLVDLASSMPASLATCYDDIHFNENGARRVSEIMATQLIADGVVRSPR